MSKVISNMSMSLDGIVNSEIDGIESVFKWMISGSTEANSANPNIPLNASENDADYLNKQMSSIGAMIAGRKVFDEANGWGGTHPLGVPVVIMTHSVPEGWPKENSKIEFIDGDIANAIKRAKELAGEKDVVIATPNIIKQAIEAGMLDVITIDMTPVILGKGLHYFENLNSMKVLLSEPEIIMGNGVVHLRFEVLK